MFADPLVLTRKYTTITADASRDLSMPCSERAPDHSLYRATDSDLNEHKFFIGHQYGRRWRFTARYTVNGFIPSLVVPTENNTFEQSCYVVFDSPTGGPVPSTSTVTRINAEMMVAIGSWLVVTATGNPLFDRVSRLGET